jgi:2-polyprenyl-6-methoxyphenol hydroxylase-like FAD-dependent oxidoreductase
LKRFHDDVLSACDQTSVREKVTLRQRFDKGPGIKTGPQVAVIGGSASGFFTASLLARAGCAVEVVERSEHLDPTPRTLIVTNHMRTLLGKVGEAAIVNEIRKFELFTDGRAAQVPLHRPDLIVERSELIRALARDAQSHGAKVSFGNRFMGLQSNGTGLRVSVERAQDARPEELHADVVVGADGALSRVAQSAGWPRQPTVPLVQAIVRVPGDMSPDTVRVWFVPDDTPYFYWLIPESSERAVLGLIGEDGQETRRGSRPRVPCRRCRRSGESLDGWRDCHRISRGHWSQRIHHEWWRKPRTAFAAPGTRSSFAHSQNNSSIQAGRLQSFGGPHE